MSEIGDVLAAIEGLSGQGGRVALATMTLAVGRSAWLTQAPNCGPGGRRTRRNL